MSIAMLYGVGGGKDLTLFRQLVDKSIKVVTEDDLDGVTTIADNTFTNCLQLRSISMSNSITRIGFAAFRGCTALQNIVLSSAITNMGEWLFDNCNQLTSIIIRSNISNIGAGTFNNCYRLKKIVINSSIPTLSNVNAFNNTNNCPIYVPFYTTTATNWVSISSRLFPLVDTVADLSNIDTTAYTKACVIGADESYKEYTYDGSQWNEVV